MKKSAIAIQRQKARKPSLASGIADYSGSVRSSFYGLWRGNIGIASFIDSMNGGIYNAFTRAWHRGAAECGVSPSELTSEELNELQRFINEETSYAVRVGFEILESSRAAGGKWTPFRKRVALWSNKFMAVHDAAMSMACRDQKLEWVWSPEKEHCSDCMRLNGRVYRASIWRKYDIRPRMLSLECKGFRCGCRFRKTDKSVTPGRPPMIGGL